MNEDVDKLRRLLQDLEDQHTTGFVDDAQYAEHRARLERRLVEAVMKGPADAAPPPAATTPATVRPETPPPASAARPSRRGLRVALPLLALACIAGGGAWWWGAQGKRPAAPTAVTPPPTQASQAAAVEPRPPPSPAEAPASISAEALPLQPPAAAAASSPPAAAAVRSGGAASVQGTVSLSPTLAARAHPGDTVFVYARAVDGPPMPLALTRAQVKDLPLRFRFDDSMALWSSAKLSSFASVVVMARVSKSGEGVPRAGDLQGQSAPVPVGSDAVRIDIDTVIAK